MKKQSLLTLGILWLTTPAWAQFTIDQVLNTPFPTELKAAPAGNKAAWVFNQRGARNIWLADGPNFSAHQLTSYKGDNGQDITSLAFTPDGNTIVFVRGGAPNSAGEIPNPTQTQEGIERAIFSLIIKGKEPKKLATGYNPKIAPKGDVVAYITGGQVWTVPTDGAKGGSKLFQARGSQGSVVWSPDGSQLAFVSNRGDHRFIGVYSFRTKEVRFLDPSVDQDQDPVWSPDGQSLAFIRQPHVKDELIFEPIRESQPWSIRVVNVSTGKGREVWKAAPGRGSAFFDAGLVADNHLFWTTDNYLVFPHEGDGWHHLYAVAATGGAARLLTPNAGEVEYALLANDKKSVIYNANIGDIDRRHVWQVSPAGGSPKPLTTGEGIEWAPAQTNDGQLLVLRSDAQRPARPALFAQPGTGRDLTPGLIPADFPASQLVQPQAVMITAADGMKIPAQLFLPKNHKSGAKHPAAIFFHGGSRRQMLLGFNYGSYYHNAYAMNQYLASKGYVVLSVNYRSGIGYGMEFREALKYGATGASEYNDVVGAGKYLQSRDDVDGKRIGLWGGSYGGYLTALGLSRAPDLFAAGVDIHGVHDWNVAVKNFIPSYDAAKRADWAKVAFESSPMHSVDNWKSPVLLIHGDDDRNVPFSETVTLAEALRKNKVYFEQLIFPDEVHSFLLYRHWLEAFQATDAFFDNHLIRRTAEK